MPNRLTMALLAGTALSVLTGGVGHAQTPAPAQTNGAPLSAKDKHFLVDDAHGASYELKASQFAADKAQDPAVRSYAQMLVTDHSRYNQALEQFGQANGVDLPLTPTKAQSDKLNRLNRLQGAQFDRRYVAEMKTVNQNDIETSQREEQSTSNQQIKGFIEQFKDMDQKHAQDAQQLQANGASKS